MNRKCGTCGDESNRAAFAADQLCEDCHQQRELAEEGMGEYAALLEREDKPEEPL